MEVPLWITWWVVESMKGDGDDGPDDPEDETEGDRTEPAKTARTGTPEWLALINRVTDRMFEVAREFPSAEAPTNGAGALAMAGWFLATDIAVLSALVHAGYGPTIRPHTSLTYADTLSTLIDEYRKLGFVRQRRRSTQAVAVERTKANLQYIFGRLRSHYRRQLRSVSRDGDLAQRRRYEVRQYVKRLLVEAVRLFKDDLSKEQEGRLLIEFSATIDSELAPNEAAISVTQVLFGTSRDHVKQGASGIVDRQKSSYEVEAFLDEKLGRRSKPSGE